MFKKVFEYAGPHKKDLYIATFIVLLSVLMGVRSLCAGLSGDLASCHGQLPLIPNMCAYG